MAAGLDLYCFDSPPSSVFTNQMEFLEGEKGEKIKLIKHFAKFYSLLFISLKVNIDVFKPFFLFFSFRLVTGSAELLLFWCFL